MAERQKIGRETIQEKQSTLTLPSLTIITGIYREKGRLVVRKFEEQAGIRIPLDEEYALNVDDAVIVFNIMFHKTHQFTLN